MRKDLKKRLERALMTLQEPGGSTIRSIIKVINKESPILSLRKVLEALQEGINEGFLCMYNGRFKLKQQLTAEKSYRGKNACDGDRNPPEEKESEEVIKQSETELYNEESECSSDDGDSMNLEEEGLTNLKKSLSGNLKKPIKNKPGNKSGSKYHSSGTGKHSTTDKSSRIPNKRTKKFNGSSYERECKDDNEKWSSGDDEDSMSDGYEEREEEERSRNKAADRLDLKKQRGPRCTSMKKDVRMPSKVNIPFMPPTIPQRSSTFNELLRRSPEPFNGPLYDNYSSFSFKPDKLEYFGAYS